MLSLSPLRPRSTVWRTSNGVLHLNRAVWCPSIVVWCPIAAFSYPHGAVSRRTSAPFHPFIILYMRAPFLSRARSPSRMRRPSCPSTRRLPLPPPISHAHARSLSLSHHLSVPVHLHSLIPPALLRRAMTPPSSIPSAFASSRCLRASSPSSLTPHPEFLAPVPPSRVATIAFRLVHPPSPRHRSLVLRGPVSSISRHLVP
ncbi:hypothetical protein DENSPDRAFT_886974 [Dentipellis sp. KUC8613]|nr:hypothetical protein DENSPDRAFT_886974 [Dentipellis sp. KUC8613]